MASCGEEAAYPDWPPLWGQVPTFNKVRIPVPFASQPPPRVLASVTPEQVGVRVLAGFHGNTIYENMEIETA